MLDSLRQISILSKIFNVNRHEGFCVFAVWILKFLYRIGFVIGWTLLIAIFVSKYGINALPYLFIIIAVFTMIGSTFYAAFLDKMSSEKMVKISVFVAGLLIFIAAQQFYSNQVWFFALLILAIAIFSTQLKIALDRYTEELFTPLQSERTFPLIESSETIGGIVAGLAISLFPVSIETFRLIYLWLAALFLIVPLIHYFEDIDKGVPVLDVKKKHKERGLITSFKKEFLRSKYSNYLKGFFLIVFLQWVIFNLLEFQYTKAIYQSVSHVILEAGSGFENIFIHDLGILFILCNVSALVVQLLLGSRFINNLGIVGSMLLHYFVTFLSLLGLTFSFNFNMAVLAKNNFSITTVIYNNAYHSSYYILPDKMREYIREFLEGIIRPLGAIVGTLTIIIFQRFLAGQELIFYVNVILIGVSAFALYGTFYQRQRYTKLAVSELVDTSNKEVRISAAEILSQRGHKIPYKVFSQILSDEKESVSVKVAVLKAIAELQAWELIDDVLTCLKSSKSVVQSSAIDSIATYKQLQNTSRDNLMLRYKVINALRALYKAEKNQDIMIKIIHLMSKMSAVSTLEFLIKILESSNLDCRAEAIFSLSNYSDLAVASLVKPYLNSDSDKEKIAAAIALFQFKEFKLQALEIIDDLLDSKNNEKVKHALYAIGELKLKHKKFICLKYLHDKNVDLQLNAIIALIKIGLTEAIPSLIRLLMTGDEKLINESHRLLANVDVRIYKNLDKIIKQVATDRVKEVMDINEGLYLTDLGKDDLFVLKNMYLLSGQYEEVELINNLIKI